MGSRCLLTTSCSLGHSRKCHPLRLEPHRNPNQSRHPQRRLASPRTLARPTRVRTSASAVESHVRLFNASCSSNMRNAALPPRFDILSLRCRDPKDLAAWRITMCATSWTIPICLHTLLSRIWPCFRQAFAFLLLCKYFKYFHVFNVLSLLCYVRCLAHYAPFFIIALHSTYYIICYDNFCSLVLAELSHHRFIWVSII